MNRNINTTPLFWKNDTICLKGIMMIIVISLHLLFILDQRYNIYLPYINWQKWGSMAVGTFLLITGFGLTSSIVRRGNVNRKYIFKSVKKLIYPFIGAFLLGLIACSIVSPLGFYVKEFFTLTIPYTTSWFIKYIFCTYLVTLLLFKYLKKTVALITLFILTIGYIVVCKSIGLQSCWYDSAICFPLGSLSFFVLNIRHLPPLFRWHALLPVYICW